MCFMVRELNNNSKLKVNKGNFYKNLNYKTWQYWVPRLTNISSDIAVIAQKKITTKHIQVPKILIRTKYSVENQSKDDIFILPKHVGTSLIPSRGTKYLFLFKVSDKKYRKFLKSFVNYFALSLLGYVHWFKIFLRVRGLGYKVYSKNEGREIHFKLGFSHIVIHKFKFGIFSSNLGIKDRMFTIEGDNWLMLTTMAARLFKLKKIDVYRGKGIFKKFFSYKIKQSRKKKK